MQNDYDGLFSDNLHDLLHLDLSNDSVEVAKPFSCPLVARVSVVMCFELHFRGPVSNSVCSSSLTQFQILPDDDAADGVSLPEHLGLCLQIYFAYSSAEATHARNSVLPIEHDCEVLGEVRQLALMDPWR